MSSSKKKAVARPTVKFKDLKSKKDPKGGGGGQWGGKKMT
jgi:hypothetical protein